MGNCLLLGKGYCDEGGGRAGSALRRDLCWAVLCRVTELCGAAAGGPGAHDFSLGVRCFTLLSSSAITASSISMRKEVYWW